MKPRVLMVTGAYYPELSGGGIQARGVIHALRADAEFAVLTTSGDRSLPAEASDDGVPVRRVFVDVTSAASRATAAVRLAAAYAQLAGRFDIVNLHGFSKKAILLVGLSRLLGKKFALTFQTAVHDEPAAARAAGAAASWAYRHADLYLSVSPRLSRAYLDAGLPETRLRQVCNAVDTTRFRPATPAERAALRRDHNLPIEKRLVLFVGYFSRDKRPDLLYDAWSTLAKRDPSSVLLFVGATRRIHQEVEPAVADAVRARIQHDGLAGRVIFVDPTTTVEHYFRAADVYVLPSIREGLPIALIEAMACGLPCIATRIPGATDVLIEDAVNGRLIAPDDAGAFTDAIESVMSDDALALRFGAAARQTVIDRYSIAATAPLWLAAYAELAAS